MSPRFSERVGAVKVQVQIRSMNEPLRNSIWNFVESLILNRTFRSQHNQTIDKITQDVLRVPTKWVDHGDRIGWLLDRVQKLSWEEMYDLLKYVVTIACTGRGQYALSDELRRANQSLAREHSGYRFVNGELAPITNPTEIGEIEEAAARAAATGLDGVREQIAQAVKLLGQRPEPDYRNAMKEAISAVEGVVKRINGTRGGGLHGALEAVSAKIEMHPALKAGLEKLYAYTSDEDGIRHAIIYETNVDEADARFMIVACSAFVNFLIVKAEAAGLLKAR